MWLSPETFRTVLAATPLVSIDLLVRDGQRRLLLGRRHHAPAQGYWFVPGGRIRKGETLDAAFQRLTEAELGRACERSQSRMIGVFEHHYPDCVFDGSVSTHYIVLAHELTLDAPLPELPQAQHAAYAWWRPAEAAASDAVHPYTRQYCQ